MCYNETHPHDDVVTIVSISALSYILVDVLHEGLGHGVTALFSGAHVVTLSTVELQSDVTTRWVSANGTLVNLIFAALFWYLLRKRYYGPATRYFFVLAFAGNLFTGTGYFLFSGISNFGDWADVIQGRQPHWAWRLALIILGMLSYFASMLLVANQLQPFKQPALRRLRVLCFAPYFTEGLLAGIAGLLNPAGLFYVVASALPSTLGANAGLLSLPSMMRRNVPLPEDSVETISRSLGWIATAAIATLLFVFVVGHGLTWSR